MRLFGRSRRAEREAMVARLMQLHAQAGAAGEPEVVRIYDSFLLYATVGRDRRKLTMDWADMAEREVAAYRDRWAPLLERG